MAIGKQPDVGGEDIGAEDSGGDGSLFAEINITPLTDVFLVMVVIFMVSALAVQAEQNQQKKQVEKKQKEEEANAQRGLKLNLPQGKAMEIDTQKQSLVLEVPVTGDVVIGGKPFPDAELDTLFKRAYQKDHNTQVVLKADKSVAHGRVVNLMERAKLVGLSHLAIGTGK
jgi:biopolymer transport protein ExbD